MTYIVYMSVYVICTDERPSVYMTGGVGGGGVGVGVWGGALPFGGRWEGGSACVHCLMPEMRDACGPWMDRRAPHGCAARKRPVDAQLPTALVCASDGWRER